MAANQVVIQSFNPNRITVHFRDAKGNPVPQGTGYKTVTVPSVYDSPKNILPLSKADFEAIKDDCQQFIDLGQRGKGFVILNDIPSGYWDPAQQVAQVKADLGAKAAELEGANSRIGQLEEQITVLKAELIARGWKEDGQ